MRAVLFFAFVLPLAACSSPSAGHGGGGDGGAGAIDGLVSIDVEPANQTLIIDGTTPATSSVQGHRHVQGRPQRRRHQPRSPGGSPDPTLGSFAAAAFTSGVDHGGATSVTASAGHGARA